MSWIGVLLDRGYTILDIKKMQLSDIELMVEALETKIAEKKEEVVETTLDKAFPFVFG
ncbi:TPA: hypothetical protein U1B35_001989 [Streptococcus suis]|nr:hypothetical protein [Streptococcus suis]